MKKLCAQLFLILFFTAAASGQIYQLGEMNTDQIRALDRQKTVVLLPGGVMEQHGPYLPSFTDGMMNEWWTRHLAESIVARPGWTAVVFPLIPLGHGGANEIGGKFNFPGSYGLRARTLRSVYMDLATEFGEQGFRWIFIIQNHGSPLHNQMLDQAGDYFNDVYKGRMVNLFGLEPAGSSDPGPAPEFTAENGVDIHAGMSETSRMIFLRPDLVSPSVRNAKVFKAAAFPDLGKVAERPDWLGYFGSPRLANASFGSIVMNFRAAKHNELALKILDGVDPKTIPRYADEALKNEAKLVENVLRHDSTIEKQQQDWLLKRATADRSLK